MPLPSFTVVGNLFEITGEIFSSELLESAPTTLRFTFTPNLSSLTTPITYGGNLYKVGIVYGGVEDDGTIVQASMVNGQVVTSGDPIQLLAENGDLNVSGLMWRVALETPLGTRWQELAGWWIDAYADGATVDLSAVPPAVQADANLTFVDVGDVASPLGKLLLAAFDAQAARTVINALSSDDVGDEIAAAIAADETVIDAAAAAVTADIEGRDLLEKGDPGAPFVADPEGDRIAASIGPLGEFLFGINADGTAEFNAVTVGDDVVTTSVDAEDLLWAPVVFSDNNYSEIHVDKDGRVQQWALDAWAERMGLGSVGGGGTVHVLIGLGQSNMSGRGLPISDEIDPPNPRIVQYGANASEITTATVPLDMVDAESAGLDTSAYGISPLTLIAREYLQRLPVNDVILLIPAAKGGSAVGYSDSESVGGVWNTAYEGESLDLYGMAKAQITAALAAAETRWPNMTLRIAGAFWHQGEANASFTEADYATELDAIITGLRTHVSMSLMPFVIGGLVPEWVAARSGTHDGVVAAHVNTPNRVVRTGYAIPPGNSGGNVSLNPADLVHFHREALEELSRRMLLAWDRALRNTTTSVPIPPAVVSATVNGTTLTVEWSQPMCRYTAFTVEYSLNGGAWTAITHTTVNTTATTTIAATLPVQVRVSTTNNVGTSQPSTPVYATLIKEP